MNPTPDAAASSQRWICRMCGWVYDPALGLWRRRIEPGTAFELLGGDFRCPACGASKAYFEPTA